MLLNQLDRFEQSNSTTTVTLSYAAEACCFTSKWDHLKSYLDKSSESLSGDFNVGIGTALLTLYEGHNERFLEVLQVLRDNMAGSLTKSNTMSIQACHDIMLRLHAVTEVEMLSGVAPGQMPDKSELMSSLNLRLDLMGAFLPDKQYLLCLRRAAMQLSR